MKWRPVSWSELLGPDVVGRVVAIVLATVVVGAYLMMCTAVAT